MSLTIKNKVLVNDDKVQRAKDILDLFVRAPRTDDEEEFKSTFGRHLSEAKVDPKGDEALIFVYKLMGGFVRTEAEEKVAVGKAKELKKKKVKR